MRENSKMLSHYKLFVKVCFKKFASKLSETEKLED